MVARIRIEFGRYNAHEDEAVAALTIPALIQMGKRRGPNAPPLKVGLLMGNARDSSFLTTRDMAPVPFRPSPLAIVRCVGLNSCAAVCFMWDDPREPPSGAVVHANCGQLSDHDIDEIKKLLRISVDRPLRDVYVAIAAPEYRDLPDGLASYEPLASSLLGHGFPEDKMIIVGIGEMSSFGMNTLMHLGY